MWADCVTADKATDKDGYIRCYYKGRNDVMHRAVWDLANGPIPSGMVVRHKCDNPACFNLNHLELGTNADNANDRKVRNPESWRVKGESNPRARMTEAQVLELRASNEPISALAKRYSIGETTVSDIKAGRTWKHLNDRGIHSTHAALLKEDANA